MDKVTYCFFSSRRRHTRCALVTGVQTCALPISYLFAYHSRLGKVTPLDGEFCTDGEADCLYLHDLAVAVRAAGRGIGPALVRHNLQQAGAAQLRSSALVSVQDSTGFCSRLGSEAYDELDPPQASNLAIYTIPAVYIVPIVK